MPATINYTRPKDTLYYHCLRFPTAISPSSSRQSDCLLAWPRRASSRGMHSWAASFGPSTAGRKRSIGEANQSSRKHVRTYRCRKSVQVASKYAGPQAPQKHGTRNFPGTQCQLARKRTAEVHAFLWRRMQGRRRGLYAKHTRHG